MKKSRMQCLTALLSTTLLLSSMPMLPAVAADCVIDTETTYQTIQGFGGINHPEWTGYDLTDAEVQRAFGDGEGELGMSILRIFVNDDSSQWSRAIPVAKKAQALGATVFASPWCPPAAIRTGGSGGPRGGKYVLSNGAEEKYAQHLNSFIKFVEGQGVNLYSVSVQNEPDWSNDWTYWSPERAANFIANYGQTVKAGTNAKLMSPESFSYSKDYYNAILNNQKAMANCDLFGTHFYGTQRNAMDFPAMENCGKDIWMTEVYVPDSNISCEAYPQSLDQSENIHNGLVVGNMNAYVVWYIKRSYGPLNEQGQISKRGYCFGQYSMFVRPGAVRVDATEQPASNVLVSAFKNEDGSVAVVAINKGTGEVNQNFSMNGGEKISGVDAYRTSATENAASVSVASVSDSGFTAKLPAKSVTTFVIDAGEAQPDPNGYLFHYTFEKGTEGFSGRGGAAVENSSDAYEGDKSLSVTGREKNWHGASHSLSASKFKAGESYAFSAVVKQDTASSEPMHFSIQYTGSDGDPHYDKIASASVPKGEWVQLYNPSYTIPAGATDVQIYFETDEDAGSTCSFTVDEVIGAPAGTAISGPAPVEFTLGDLNGDGKINGIDFSLVKQGILKGGFADAASKLAADVTQDGAVNVSDAVWYAKFLTGEVEEFGKAENNNNNNNNSENNYNNIQMRTITEYTAAVKDSVVMTETSDSKQKKAGVTYPQITKEYYFSKKANKNKPYNIMLPANYDESKKYPVLYLLHGFFEDEDRMILTGNENPIPTPQIITNAIAEGAAKEMIVVVPQVFTHPTKAGATAFNDGDSVAGYDNFVDDIVDSLMPHIESKYSVATGKANTAVTGFSMGGKEALCIGIKHSDKFGYVGAICPAPGVQGPWKWSSEEAAPSLIMVTGGTNDDVVRLDTPQGYHNELDKAGTPHIWHVVQGGYHGDNCIRAHLYNFVRYIFKA